MKKYCDNCGEKSYNGACTNCHEEIYIEKQYEELDMIIPDQIIEIADKHRKQINETK